jgi:hypothetical protein
MQAYLMYSQISMRSVATLLLIIHKDGTTIGKSQTLTES